MEYSSAKELQVLNDYTALEVSLSRTTLIVNQKRILQLINSHSRDRTLHKRYSMMYPKFSPMHYQVSKYYNDMKSAERRVQQLKELNKRLLTTL